MTVLIWIVTAAATLLATPGTVAASPTVTEKWKYSSVLKGVGRMAEATVAIDPGNPDHIAVAADPYGNPTRIRLTVTRDGGTTWSRPVWVVPPGASRSFDPELAFTRSGTLLVGGGAARPGRPYCLPDSAIFLARMRGSRIRYETVAKPRQGVYVDRPSLAYDRATDATVMSWTRSTGASAHCLAEPARARTWVAWRAGRAPFRVHRLPAAAPAVFGSDLQVIGAGRVAVAIAGWNRSRRQTVRISALDLADGVQARLSTRSAGVRPPLLPRPGHPLNLAVPSLSAHGVAWTQKATGGGNRVMVSDLDNPRSFRGPSADGTPYLPTLAAGGGTLWLLEARVHRNRLRYVLWRRHHGSWVVQRTIHASRQSLGGELGQLLGLAAQGGTVAVAVPDGDRLVAAVHQRPTRTAGRSAGPRSAAAAPPRPPAPASSEAGGARYLWWLFALVLAPALVLLWRRRPGKSP